MYIESFAIVMPGLHIGGRDAATNLMLHRRLRFTLVVNCTNHVPYVRPRDPGCTYIKVGVEDNLAPREIAKMGRMLPNLVSLIRAHIDSGGRVLVHCEQGRQRSAAVVAATLMSMDPSLTPDGAIEQVRTAKNDTFRPSPNFMQVLHDYYTRTIPLGGLHRRPGG